MFDTKSYTTSSFSLMIQKTLWDLHTPHFDQPSTVEVWKGRAIERSTYQMARKGHADGRIFGSFMESILFGMLF